MLSPLRARWEAMLGSWVSATISPRPVGRGADTKSEFTVANPQRQVPNRFVMPVILTNYISNAITKQS